MMMYTTEQYDRKAAAYWHGFYQCASAALVFLRSC